MYVVKLTYVDRKSINGLQVVFCVTRKSLEDSLNHLKRVLRAPPGGRLNDVLKKFTVTPISDQSMTSLRPSLRPKFRRLYNVCGTPLCYLGC